ncbi:MAG TPA: YetF domain-containing protein [Thermomicrobiales bacterium]|nr:YetF domain-containing protein [Thermomicrobiales bacterium]
MGPWLGEVFSHPDLPVVLGIVAKTAIIYVLLIAGLRLLGTRELGQMTTYDLVLIVVIANAVQNALVGGDNTLVGGLVSALTLLALNRLFTWLLDHFPALERRMVGEPVVLVSDGVPRWSRMRREGVTREELMAGLREHGVASLDAIRLAVLEVDGTISVVPKEAQVHRTHRRFRGLRTT